MSEEIEAKSHSKLSPSASKRWMTCAGSIKLQEKLGIENSTSKFAAEGTVAHEVHELCLVKNLDANDYLGKKFKADGFEFVVNKNMAEAVQESLDYIRDRIEEAALEDMRVEILVEVKASLSYIGIPGLDGGTSDVVLLFWAPNEDEPGKEYLHSIEVLDYKHGAGVVVEAEDNTQALNYTLGVIMNPRFNGEGIPGGIRITISQPRAFHKLGPIRWWEVDKDFVYNWEEDELIPAAKLTLEDDAPIVPSEEGCKFCPCAPCGAQYQMVQEQAMVEFEGEQFPDPVNMTIEQKISVAEHIPMIRSFLVAVENSIKVDVDAGSTDYKDHFKLVRSKTNRKFTEEALDEDFSPLVDHLEHSDMYVEKPRSMTEIEKRLKKKVGVKDAKVIMDDITTKPEGKLVVAPLSDKRKAVEPSVTGDFNGMEDEE